MSERLENLIKQIRHNLSDTRKQKWSDDRLKYLIDDAQSYINRQHGVLSTEEVVYILPRIKKYKLSNEIVFIKRAESYNFINIPFYHYSELDRRDVLHQTAVGSKIECISYGGGDSYNTIEIYPMIESQSSDYYVDSITNPDGSIVASVADVYNDIIEYQNLSAGGIISYAISDDIIEINDIDGGVAVWMQFVDVIDIVRLFYVRKSKSVFDINDLELPSSYDMAIIFYVCYRAYLDYTDREMLVKGREFLNLFNSEMVRLKGLTSSHNKYFSDYNDFVYKMI